MPPTSSSTAAERALERQRRDNLGRLLVDVFDRFEGLVVADLAARGIVVEPTWLPVLRNVPLRGARISEIAAAARLAKQTVGPIVRQLAAAGVVTVRTDRSDRRAKLVRYTARGLDGLRTGLAAQARAEAHLERIVGRRALAALRQSLRTIRDTMPPPVIGDPKSGA
ncbi:MAG: MarR family winged helix-turn-helix transcriptional regulator [Gemmatimonadales bacterium]